MRCANPIVGVRRAIIVFFCSLFLCPYQAVAFVYTVDSLPGLMHVLQIVKAGDSVLLEDGQYRLDKDWAIKIDVSGITMGSASGNCEKVVVLGRGMFADKHHGIFVNADDVVIIGITIQNVRNHCIQLASGKSGLKVINCVLRDAGEQLLKGAGHLGEAASKGCLIKDSLFEYSNNTGPRWYIGGIDVHNGDGWIVRNNIFRNIRSPGKSIAEHAIHFWSNSKNTVVEDNYIENCDRGIGFGMGKRGHSGGVIQNNTIYQDGNGIFNDVGIILESSPGTRVAGNTVIILGDYPNSIEYRFPSTRGVVISGNQTNQPIRARDGATAQLFGNTIIGGQLE